MVKLKILIDFESAKCDLCYWGLRYHTRHKFPGRLSLHWIWFWQNPSRMCAIIFDRSITFLYLWLVRENETFFCRPCVHCGFYLPTHPVSLWSQMKVLIFPSVLNEKRVEQFDDLVIFLLLLLQLVLAVPTWRWMYYKPRSRLWLSFSWMAFNIDCLSSPENRLRRRSDFEKQLISR